MTELDILKRPEIHSRHAELPPDLRYDFGSLGTRNLVSAPEPRCTNRGAFPYVYRRGFCLPGPCERTKGVQNYARHE
jgi:hypothetical protein